MEKERSKITVESPKKSFLEKLKTLSIIKRSLLAAILAFSVGIGAHSVFADRERSDEDRLNEVINNTKKYPPGKRIITPIQNRIESPKDGGIDAPNQPSEKIEKKEDESNETPSILPRNDNEDNSLEYALA